MYNLQILDLFYKLLENYLYSNSFIFSTFFLKVCVFLSPEFFLILAILIYLCIIKNFNNFYINSLFFLFVLILEFFLIFFNFLYTLYFGKFMPQLFFSSCFIFDTYSNFCKFIIILFLILIIVFSEHKFIWNKPFGSCIYIPLFFFLFFSLFLLSSFDLFTAYLSLEGVSLSIYILAANSYQKRVAIEATIKYFVFGGVSNGLLLLGNSIVFSLCGSLNYIEVKYLLNSLYFNLSNIEVSFSLICFLIVFFFKVAAFPCHMWSPDVYEGVWLSLTTILIVLVKLLYFFFFFKVFFYLFIKLFYLWQPFILFSSIGSLLIGSFGIIGQNRIKRLMAYSSINHVSFILLGMACGSLAGLANTILYLIVYSFTVLLFFGFILNTSSLINGRSLVYLGDFANLTKFSAFGSQGLLIILFSMGGLPPLAGFFIKFYIYLEAISSDLYIFVFFSLLVTIVSTFYYLFFLKCLFFDKNILSSLVSLSWFRPLPFFIMLFGCAFLICFIFITDIFYDFAFLIAASAYSPFFYFFF